MAKLCLSVTFPNLSVNNKSTERQSFVLCWKPHVCLYTVTTFNLLMTYIKFCIFVHPVNAKFTIGQYRSTVDSQLNAGINICAKSRGATFENFRYRFYFIRQFWTAWKCNKSLVLVILYIIIFSRFDTKRWISEIENSRK